MRARGLLVVAAALVACNAITGLSDDYQLAARAGDGDGGPGTGTGRDDAAPPTLLGDGAPATDGGARFCSSVADPAAFCADFDDPGIGPPSFGWDGAGGERVGGDFVVEEGVGRGGSRGLRVRATADGGASMKVSLWKTLAGGLPTTTALYDLRFDFHVRSSTMDYAALATLAFPVQDNLLTYGLSWYGDHFDTSSPPGPGDPDRLTEGPGAWHTGTLRLERNDAGTYTLHVAIDGVRIDEKTNLSLGTATTAQVRIGAYFTSVSPSAIDVVFDNVVATRK